MHVWCELYDLLCSKIVVHATIWPYACWLMWAIFVQGGAIFAVRVAKLEKTLLEMGISTWFVWNVFYMVLQKERHIPHEKYSSRLGWVGLPQENIQVSRGECYKAIGCKSSTPKYQCELLNNPRSRPQSSISGSPLPRRNQDSAVKVCQADVWVKKTCSHQPHDFAS